MYHTWFFQKRLASALDRRLKDLTLAECFSQQKDELIMAFANEKSEVYIRADFGKNAGLIVVQEEFARARKNSIDLFSEIVDQNVKAVDCYTHERSFRVSFENGYYLIFKMHGSRSNVLLAIGDRVERIFRNNLDRDLLIVPSDLSNNSELDEDLIRRLRGKNFHTSIDDLESDYMSICKEGPTLKFGTIDGCHTTSDPIVATNKYAEYFYRFVIFQKEQERLLSGVSKKIKQCENYLEKSLMKHKEIQESKNPEEIGHLIMANLHQIPEGSSTVILTDFYTNAPVKIKLKPKLTPQKNAEVYYRKGKNRKIELEMVQVNIEKKRVQLNDLQSLRDKVMEIEDIRELRKLSTQLETREQKNEPKPYHLFRIYDWSILVGKNAKSNDELTLKVAKKNDLWLHAKDVAGSHVVIKEIPGRKYPKDVIEKAASLAAYYSKRKTDSLCPVIFTPKKFVRKVKGTPAGQVMVDREEVVMVEPTNRL